MGTIYCPKCGKDATDQDLFCSKCGFNFARDSAPQGSTEGRPKRLKWIIIGGVTLILITILFLPYDKNRADRDITLELLEKDCAKAISDSAPGDERRSARAFCEGTRKIIEERYKTNR